MRHLWLLTVCAAALLCVSCSEEDCYYCGKDITGAIVPDTDVPVIPKETDKPQPDNAVKDDGETSDELTDADLLPTENMVLIEAATFQMGCEEEADPNCAETNALPRHEVTVPTFEMDVYEVTKGEYEACIEAGACQNDVDNGKILYKINDGNNPFCVLQGPLSDSFPANCISWEGARVYCAWVGKRLPSEAEWELAARGTDDRIYPWGDTPPLSCDNTVMDDSTGSDTSWGCGGGLSMPVGSKPSGKSPYDIYDMAGNVWEWCEDDWHNNYDDSATPSARPDDGTAWIDEESPPNRVIRGGSFMLGTEDSFEFLTYAHYGAPADVAGESRGFRCAR